MLARFLNEVTFDVTLRPRGPILIKSGAEGDAAIDPTLPDMNFVRTRPPGGEEMVYIPGSSLRGVVRSHAERLVRSVAPNSACDPTTLGRRSSGLVRPACDPGGSRGGNSNAELTGPQAYTGSCYACQLFGNTALASRVRVGDLYPTNGVKPLISTRYGVAIDRVTNAVAQGPFELETVTDGEFAERITARNLTVGQFGLLAAALLDISDGLVPIGYGKSRGLGRVQLAISVSIRTLEEPKGAFVGAGALCSDEERKRYALPGADADRLPLPGAASSQGRGLYELRADGDQAVAWLEAAAMRWPSEVQR